MFCPLKSIPSFPLSSVCRYSTFRLTLPLGARCTKNLALESILPIITRSSKRYRPEFIRTFSQEPRQLCVPQQRVQSLNAAQTLRHILTSEAAFDGGEFAQALEAASLRALQPELMFLGDPQADQIPFPFAHYALQEDTLDYGTAGEVLTFAAILLLLPLL